MSVNGDQGAGANEVRDSNFMRKPEIGWLHPDKKLSDGVCYGVRYVGCLEVSASMKSLDYPTRSLIAVECINRVCEAAGLKTVDRRRKVDRRIRGLLGTSPIMDHAGWNVTLQITSSSLQLISLDSGEPLITHEMPNISFASAGDSETLDFVAYVAKDAARGRACYVLECGAGLAQDVITTVGQAFELRFEEYLKRMPGRNNHGDVCGAGDAVDSASTNGTASSKFAAFKKGFELPPAPRGRGDDPEYYNDLPGKIPPDSVVVPPTPLTAMSTASTAIVGGGPRSAVPFGYGPRAAPSHSDLIDLSSEPSTPCDPNKDFSDVHQYVNDLASLPSTPWSPPPTASTVRDPFDMQPFAALSNGYGPHREKLLKEPWFHGPISRKEAEVLVCQDGEFLVRESVGSPGQYVLTGMQNGQRKHLLLVDPEGVVRTKDRTFESVSHLINHHTLQQLPIISAESALLLKIPIVKRAQ